MAEPKSRKKVTPICLDQSINVTSFGSTLFSTSSLVTRYQSSSEPTVPKISSTAVLPREIETGMS